MAKTPQTQTLLFVGSGGRLGQLLSGVWDVDGHGLGAAYFASRDGQGDITLDADDLPDTLPACDSVVALWGVTSGDKSALARNTALAEASWLVAQACGARRVFHMSSAAIYGPGRRLSEDDAPSPANAYGEAKSDMERRVAQLPHDQVAHCCLRLANVVGADSLAAGLAPGRHDPVELSQFPDDRGPLRSYISPGHLAQILVSLSGVSSENLPPVVNVAASTPVEMEDLVRAAGNQVIWRTATEGDRQTVILETQRLERLLPELALHKTASQMITDLRRAKGEG